MNRCCVRPLVATGASSAWLRNAREAHWREEAAAAEAEEVEEEEAEAEEAGATRAAGRARLEEQEWAAVATNMVPKLLLLLLQIVGDERARYG
mmetsp:Transcript_2640/g.5909  ORF Transcript_2640/g.5909 Transcript_2640/m.5909 type:complete len:93 (-) Transcript_2640:133-411(-)